MADTISTRDVASQWAAFVDVLARHHFDARSQQPACACGLPARTRRSFARHPVIALVLEGALPRTELSEWGLTRPGSAPIVMPFADALREANRADGSGRVVYRTVYPPTECVEEHDITPGHQPA